MYAKRLAQLIALLNLLPVVQSIHANNVQALLDALSEGSSVITLTGNGVYKLDEELVVPANVSVTVESDGESEATLDGQASVRLINISPGSSLTLRRIHLTNGEPV